MYRQFFPIRYAENLSAGDEVLVPENNELIPVKVVGVSSFQMQG